MCAEAAVKQQTTGLVKGKKNKKITITSDSE